ncbi:MAG TPA: HupE/UreJ family protein [Xenococcaceae cyanobacterium]
MLNISLKRGINSLACLSLVLVISLIFATPSVLAHHPLDGAVPRNFWEGFMSGLAHPIIGLDHFAFVVAVGLLAVLADKFGLIIPVSFGVTTALGTLIHLAKISLPIPELIIAISVLIIGIVLTSEKRINFGLIIAISAIAGIFHGYAYGESIVGAEMTPLGAYLFGFVIIQLIVSAIAFFLGSLLSNKSVNQSFLPLRFCGFTICGIGLSYLLG